MPEDNYYWRLNISNKKTFHYRKIYHKGFRTHDGVWPDEEETKLLEGIKKIHNLNYFG